MHKSAVNPIHSALVLRAEKAALSMRGGVKKQ
jgi:hypothetical protein